MSAAPAPGTWFVVGEYGDDDVLFKVPAGAQERDFGGPVGRCIHARRVSTEGIEERLQNGWGTAILDPEGEREWVRLDAIRGRFEAEDAVLAWLFPSMYRGLEPDSSEAEL